MINIMPLNECPSWVIYPSHYIDLSKGNIQDFLPWYFTIEEQVSWSPKELKKMYPSRDLFCFARKDCSDDIACWEKGEGSKVFIIHTFASPGWEQREIFNTFEEWYEWALSQREDY